MDYETRQKQRRKLRETKEAFIKSMVECGDGYMVGSFHGIDFSFKLSY